MSTSYYVNDWDGFLPTYLVGGGTLSYGSNLLELLEPYLRRVRPQDDDRDHSSVWRCPSDRWLYGKMGHSSGGLSLTSYEVSYSKTAYVVTDRTSPYYKMQLPRKMNDYPKPGYYDNYWTWHYPLRHPSKEPFIRDSNWDISGSIVHRGGFNVVFLDWHAQWYIETYEPYYRRNY